MLSVSGPSPVRHCSRGRWLRRRERSYKDRCGDGGGFGGRGRAAETGASLYSWRTDYNSRLEN